MTSKLIFLLAFLATGTLVSPEAKVTQVLSKDLPDMPGKEGLMLMVEYPPPEPRLESARLSASSFKLRLLTASYDS